MGGTGTAESGLCGPSVRLPLQGMEYNGELRHGIYTPGFIKHRCAQCPGTERRLICSRIGDEQAHAPQGCSEWVGPFGTSIDPMTDAMQGG
jgi:hypothetical protein